MATTNIQKTGLENSIYWISDEMFEKCYYDIEQVKEKIENLKETVEIYDKEDKRWYEIDFKVDIEPCYYDGFVLVVKGDSKGERENYWDDLLDGFELSDTSIKKLEKAVGRLEKQIKKIPGVQEIRCTARASNGEAMYVLV